MSLLVDATNVLLHLTAQACRHGHVVDDGSHLLGVVIWYSVQFPRCDSRPVYGGNVGWSCISNLILN